MAKVQGEGDYESARRYNSQTRKFVKAKGVAATRGPGGTVDEAAERKALARARDGGPAERARDAKVMAKSVTKKTARKAAKPRQ